MFRRGSWLEITPHLAARIRLRLHYAATIERKLESEKLIFLDL